MKLTVLDCTLRDGGYYNNWDFPQQVVVDYLEAMKASGVDIVELGLRTLDNNGFKGAAAFSTETYLKSLNVPKELKVSIMVNASELLTDEPLERLVEKLFPLDAVDSSVDVVRIACHVHEFVAALPVCNLLKQKGYIVGFNLMQVADRSGEEIERLALEASQYDIDVLYFADSMGSMNPSKTTEIINCLKKHWHGNLGIHTHDNMGLALSNTLQAFDDGVTWLDATVTGMGRGPGNARTEELVIEASEKSGESVNLVPLMSLIKTYFQPLKNRCGWGSNPYYYLSGKYGIHPTYIQKMLGDSRYSEEDVLAAIEHLRVEGGKKYRADTLDASREFFSGDATGNWEPSNVFGGKEVLLLGTGPGVEQHKGAIEAYIEERSPVVVALNTQSAVKQTLIDFRVACHPVRLLADCSAYSSLPQPLITPAAMLPSDVLNELKNLEKLDFGLVVKKDTFKFDDTSCIIPSSLVINYALAVITSGKASNIKMAGFDGYSADDPRNFEMNSILKLYSSNVNSLALTSITPTRYEIDTISVYGLV